MSGRVLTLLLAALAAVAPLASLASSALAQPSAAGSQKGKPGAAAGPKAARAPNAGFAIEAPATLTLGSDGPTDIEYNAPESTAARLSVNVGTLGVATRLAPGRFRVMYTPPAEKYPQIAILVLLADDGSGFAWKRIALLGTAKIAINSEPLVEVWVRVADRMFGPARTDRSGVANVPVVIPPGITQATSVAADALGNRTENATPIHVPAFNRVVSACAPERADAFWVFAVDARGDPLSKAALELTAEPLRVGKTQGVAPGVYRAALEIPQGVRTGDRVHMHAVLESDRAHARGCEVKIPVARARGLDLNAPAAIVVTARAKVPLRVVPRYLAGGAPEPIEISLTIDRGELSRSTISTAQAVELEWTPPRRIEPGEVATLIARAGKLEARVRIALRPGPVHVLELSSEHERVRKDGAVDCTLVVLARDELDNEVSDVALIATARGGVGRFEAKEPGRYEVGYSAPMGGDSRDVVRVEAASGVHATITLGEMDWLHGVFLGARGGYLTNFARVSGPLVLAQVGMRLPLRDLKIDIGLDGGWYASQYADSGAIQTDVQAVPLLARADYVIDLEPLQLRAYAGPGIMLTRAQVESSASGRVRTSDVSVMVAGGGGVALPVGPGRVVCELGYWYAHVRTDSVDGNVGGATASLGYLADL